MKQKFYLLTVLLEYSDESITDLHFLYSDYNKAKEAMTVQIEEANENFNDNDMSCLIDVPTCQEWRSDDGYGFTIGIEEITYLD